MGIEVKKAVTATCEGPHCSVVISFVEQDPDSMPDSVWRFITVVRFDTTSHLFCSKACLMDFMRTYEPLKSPKERQEIEDAAMDLRQKEVERATTQAILDRAAQPTETAQ